MSESAEKIFAALCEHARQTATLSSIDSVLGWDERTQMPPANAEHRAEQMTLLSGMIHKRNVDPQVGEWLDALAELWVAAAGAPKLAASLTGWLPMLSSLAGSGHGRDAKS